MRIFKKESQVAELVMEHVLATEACVAGAGEALQRYIAEDTEATHALDIEVGQLESQADALKRDIRDLLYSGAYLPHIRSNMYRLVKSLDKVAGAAEECTNFLDCQSPHIPEELQADLVQMYAANLAGFELLRRAFKTFFKPKGKLEKLRSRSDQVSKLESEVDDQEASLVRRAFDSDLDHSQMVHFAQYVRLVSEIADATEGAADELMFAALKSTI